MYRNRRYFLSDSVLYPSSGVKGYVHLFHPRPTVAGQQSVYDAVFLKFWIVRRDL
jgi:hypothetical protein